jgi:NADPH:quinone reductase-like Zn-dependent oxidoreductase
VTGGADSKRAWYALGEIGELIEAGRFSLPVARTFPLEQIAEAHRLSESGHVRGKLVLLVDCGGGGRLQRLQDIQRKADGDE